MEVRRFTSAADRYAGLIPHSLNFFQTNFVGKSMAGGWQAPEVTVTNRSKPAADFLSWMTAAPVVSEKAAQALSGLSNGFEFLPLLELRAKIYYAMNVVDLATDVLDLERSKIDYLEIDGSPLTLRTAAFRVIPDVPVFKVSIAPGQVFADIFVTRRFVDILSDHGLTGAVLTETDFDIFAASLLGLARTRQVAGVKR